MRKRRVKFNAGISTIKTPGGQIPSEFSTKTSARSCDDRPRPWSRDKHKLEKAGGN
jgi:hypothetical protein